MNTKSIGALLALAFSNAHESEVPSHRALEKSMDLHNNSIGIDISGPGYSVAQLSDLAYDAITLGWCWYIKPLNSDNSLMPESRIYTTNQ